MPDGSTNHLRQSTYHSTAAVRSESKSSSTIRTHAQAFINLKPEEFPQAFAGHLGESSIDNLKSLQDWLRYTSQALRMNPHGVPAGDRSGFSALRQELVSLKSTGKLPVSLQWPCEVLDKLLRASNPEARAVAMRDLHVTEAPDPVIAPPKPTRTVKQTPTIKRQQQPTQFIAESNLQSDDNAARVAELKKLAASVELRPAPSRSRQNMANRPTGSGPEPDILTWLDDTVKKDGPPRKPLPPEEVNKSVRIRERLTDEFKQATGEAKPVRAKPRMANTEEKGNGNRLQRAKRDQIAADKWTKLRPLKRDLPASTHPDKPQPIKRAVALQSLSKDEAIRGKQSAVAEKSGVKTGVVAPVADTVSRQDADLQALVSKAEKLANARMRKLPEARPDDSKSQLESLCKKHVKAAIAEVDAKAGEIVKDVLFGADGKISGLVIERKGSTTKTKTVDVTWSNDKPTFTQNVNRWEKTTANVLFALKTASKGIEALRAHSDSDASPPAKTRAERALNAMVMAISLLKHVSGQDGREFQRADMQGLRYEVSNKNDFVRAYEQNKLAGFIKKIPEQERSEYIVAMVVEALQDCRQLMIGKVAPDQFDAFIKLFKRAPAITDRRPPAELADATKAAEKLQAMLGDGLEFVGRMVHLLSLYYQASAARFASNPAEQNELSKVLPMNLWGAVNCLFGRAPVMHRQEMTVAKNLRDRGSRIKTVCSNLFSTPEKFFPVP